MTTIPMWMTPPLWQWLWIACRIIAMNRSFAAPSNGLWECRAKMADGERLKPTMTTNISITFHSMTTVHCLTHPRRMSRRAVSAFWHSEGMMSPILLWKKPSAISKKSKKTMAHGMDDGERITSMAHGRQSVRWRQSERMRAVMSCAAPSHFY